MSQVELNIGPKIKAFRRQLGMQANKLASQLNISPSYLALIEGGKRKIDGELLLKICEELSINISDLTNKSDINMVNTISELLDDQLFERFGYSLVQKLKILQIVIQKLVKLL
jgi:Predicted transcriptional regulators